MINPVNMEQHRLEMEAVDAVAARLQQSEADNPCTWAADEIGCSERLVTLSADRIRMVAEGPGPFGTGDAIILSLVLGAQVARQIDAAAAEDASAA